MGKLFHSTDLVDAPEEAEPAALPLTFDRVRSILGGPLPDNINADEEAYWAEYDSEESRGDRWFSDWGKGQ